MASRHGSNQGWCSTRLDWNHWRPEADLEYWQTNGTAVTESVANLLSALSSLIDHKAVNNNTAPNWSDAGRVDGWTAEQWAEWGRKKSKLASTIAGEQGRLRAKVLELENELAALKCSVFSAAEASGVDHGLRIDPLSVLDPWSGSTASFSNPASSADTVDLWSKWKPHRSDRDGLDLQLSDQRNLPAMNKSSSCVGNLQGSVVGINDHLHNEVERVPCNDKGSLRGSWEALPPTGWSRIYARFLRSSTKCKPFLSLTTPPLRGA
jgi:hypothetical protein